MHFTSEDASIITRRCLSADIPPRPPREQTPLFLRAKYVAPEVMRHLGTTSILVWVMYADDSIGLHKFNRNGSHKRIKT